MSDRIRVLHVINSLATGGAEGVLARLAPVLQREFDQSVTCILDAGPLASEVERAGIPVTAFSVSERVPNPMVVLRLARHIRAARPHVVQTWLYQADLVGALATRLVGRRNVVWNIRGADVSPREAHPLTRLIVQLNARLSRLLPTRIVCCAQSALTEHIRIGFDAARMTLIHNGVDVRAFVPDSGCRATVRTELGIPLDAPVIGLLARLHPQKDHDTFFAAVARLRAMRPDVHFLLAGNRIHGTEPQLAAILRRHGVWEAIHLLGERRDVARLTAALDIATSSSSWGEGFPNVIAEAMSCGVPCVATDAGDARLLVGDTGRIVPRRDPVALAAAWQDLLSLEPACRRELGRRARERVDEHFALDACAQRYARLYREIAGAA